LRLLPAQPAETLAREIPRLPHANVTTVPFNLDGPAPNPRPVTSSRGAQPPEPRAGRVVTAPPSGNGHDADGARVVVLASIDQARWRARVRLTGRVEAMRIEALAGSPTLECTVVDETGGITGVFLGRPEDPGVAIGTLVTVEGMVSEHRGRLAVLNPVYELRS